MFWHFLKRLKNGFKSKSVANNASKAPAIKASMLERFAQSRICLDREQYRALDAFEALLNPLPQEPLGLLLWGSVGTGKTLLMDTFFDCFTGHKTRLHHHELLKHLMQGMYHNRQQPHPLQSTIEQICRPQAVLGIDDFYLRDIAEAKLWQKLFDYCIQHHRMLIITSNQHPQTTLINSPSNQERIKKLIDAMLNNLTILKIDSGLDYRSLLTQALDTKQSVQISPNAFRQMMAKITQGEDRQPTQQLTIQQREVPIKVVYTDTIVFGFSDLFQGKRSCQDYLEISERFRKVCLVDYQPQMFASASTLQRLIWFIDIIYDKKIRLFWFADDLPLNTLEKSEHPNVKRTISRLQQIFACSKPS